MPAATARSTVVAAHTPRLRRFGLLALLVVFGVVLGLLAAEEALRIEGFEFHTFPTVQFGWPKPEEIAKVYVPDRDLFWVPQDYAANLAHARANPPAIVFMGDSCTQFGTYPRRTLETLRATAPALATGFSAGVGGWTTVQGLAQLTRDVLPLRPRVVTIYFGWNDHWIALGRPDAKARPGPVLWWLSQHSRLMELVIKAELGARSTVGYDGPLRVSLPEYEANLREMVSLAREARIAPVLITAPAAHQVGEEPAYLAQRHIARLSDLVPLHQRYVDATRRVARESGAYLCDAAASFPTLPPPLQQYFTKDGIHLTSAGDREMATLLARCIIEAAGAEEAPSAASMGPGPTRGPVPPGR